MIEGGNSLRFSWGRFEQERQWERLTRLNFARAFCALQERRALRERRGERVHREGLRRHGRLPARDNALWNFMAQLLNLKEFLPQHCGRNARQGLDQKTLPSTQKKTKKIT